MQLTGWEQLTPSQLLRVLKLSLAVLCNAELFLDPYCPSLFPLLRDILLSPSYLSEDGEMHHWHVRQLAAAVMAQLIKRSGYKPMCRVLSSEGAFVFTFLGME